MTCEVCENIDRTEADEDELAIARLTTGYVKLHPTQHFRGYTLFTAKQCVREVFDLPRDARQAHLYEMSEVAHALQRAFDPAKLNYEALGNGVPHLHWHLLPRYDTDPHPKGPVWEDLTFLRLLWTGGGAPTDEERTASMQAILGELRRGDVEIEAEYVIGA
jgi:diadenosine tetraphosphate (Ap4A) HIT family hydrolase